MKVAKFHPQVGVPPTTATAVPSDTNDGMVYVRVDTYADKERSGARLIEELHVRMYFYLSRTEANRLRDALDDALLDERVTPLDACGQAPCPYCGAVLTNEGRVCATCEVAS